MMQLMYFGEMSKDRHHDALEAAEAARLTALSASDSRTDHATRPSEGRLSARLRAAIRCSGFIVTQTRDATCPGLQGR